MTAPASTGLAALDRLATALGPRFATTVVTSPGRRPHLAVTCRNTLAGAEIYADDSGWFWWPWAERIGATGDPLTAAHQITAALHGTVTPPGSGQ